ncbi:hypothetical protein [Hyphomicrobium sp. DY-1]|uniref:hypothetical protein n=1 Tax=Hyphomicrobium sp. DY-1 TaxID=3075650 RepID=UPI0039C285A0
MDTNNFRDTIETTTRIALMRFVAHFGRPPDEAEALILAAAISDFFGLTNPTARRH